MPDLQQKYYDSVAEELARKFLKPGLWARAMAEAGGEDAHARAAYIRLRVAELKDEEESQSQPPISAPPVAPPLPVGPTGVGGWLTFFCVGLTILGPLWSIAQMITGYEQSAPTFGRYPDLKDAMVVENLCLVALIAYGFVVGMRIWSGSSDGRRLARQYLKARIVWFIVFECIVYAMMSDLPSGIRDAMIGGVIGAWIREGVYFAIWWSYFKKSKRVRNTYGAE